MWAVALFMVFSANIALSQDLSAEALLDKAVSMAQAGDKKADVVSVLSQGTAALNKEASATGSNPKIANKLLSQVGNLSNIASLAGGLNLGSLTKIVSTAKLLLGANRISSILGGGKSNLASNAASLTSNLGLIQAGTSLLGGSESSSLSSLIGAATSSLGKLNGVGGKIATEAASTQLTKIVDLVGSSNL